MKCQCNTLKAQLNRLKRELTELTARVGLLEGKAINELPIEPVYDMALVLQLIPCTKGQLRYVEKKYPGLLAKKYRIHYLPNPRRTVKVRVFTASEVKKLRELILRTGFFTGRTLRRKNSVISLPGQTQGETPGNTQETRLNESPCDEITD